METSVFNVFHERKPYERTDERTNKTTTKRHNLGCKFAWSDITFLSFIAVSGHYSHEASSCSNRLGSADVAQASASLGQVKKIN